MGCSRSLQGSVPVDIKDGHEQSIVCCTRAGQKSLLDIQREEAEHAAAAQAAEAAEAASRGPVITAGPGGWAKVAAANVPPPYQGESSNHLVIHSAI